MVQAKVRIVTAFLVVNFWFCLVDRLLGMVTVITENQCGYKMARVDDII